MSAPTSVCWHREAGRQNFTCGVPSELHLAATHRLIFEEEDDEEEEEEGSSCTPAAPQHIPTPPRSTEASRPVTAPSSLVLGTSGGAV